MQSFVHSVFVVVTSVIATLLMVGLSGIIVLLITDGGTPSATEHAPEADRHADHIVQSAGGSRTRPAHSTVLRRSP